LFIDPLEQKKGHGTLLLSHVINSMLREKVFNLTLDSSEEGLPLYFKAGMLPKNWFTSEKSLADWQIWGKKSLEEKKKCFSFKAEDEWLEQFGELPSYKLYLSLQNINPFTRAFWKAVCERSDYKTLLTQELQVNHTISSYKKRNIEELSDSRPEITKEDNDSYKKRKLETLNPLPSLTTEEELSFSESEEYSHFFDSIWNDQDY
jgi:hypothetical protein